jgi:hypothetical protein
MTHYKLASSLAVLLTWNKQLITLWLCSLWQVQTRFMTFPQNELQNHTYLANIRNMWDQMKTTWISPIQEEPNKLGWLHDVVGGEFKHLLRQHHGAIQAQQVPFHEIMALLTVLYFINHCLCWMSNCWEHCDVKIWYQVLHFYPLATSFVWKQKCAWAFN